MGLVDYIVIAIFAAVILAVAIAMICKIALLSKDERKEYLVTYLKGFVALAEKKVGSGNGDQKLKLVEEYFRDHAPFLTKIMLKVVGTDSLRGLIETALAELKENFSK